MLTFLIFSCGKTIYVSNGQRIYETGKNQLGEALLDKNASRIKIAHSCKTCHGRSGDMMNGVSIRFSDLSNPEAHTIPYDDRLFFRFLDQDLKSDSTRANIGVIWKMSDQDKQDLLAYLKTL